MAAVQLLLALVLACSASDAQRVRSRFHWYSASASVTVTVDQSGSGNFTSIQKAIDWVPASNSQWIRVQVKPGTYNEKVNIGWDKPYIYLEGDSQATTVVQWGDHGSAADTSTFTLLADNFIASRITFQNTYNKLLSRVVEDGSPIQQAPALMVWGDKASFYECGFIGLQDTLGDMRGRHFFNKCYIEGAIDFIWGSGQSQYEACSIHSKGGALGGNHPGYITAQGRSSADDRSGFVFKYCVVDGDGSTYLGRAYRAYSRVVFFKSYFGSNVVPRGWDAWNYTGHENAITYAEEGCQGPGSDTSNRVKWMRKLDSSEWASLLSTRQFEDADGWIEAQPGPQLTRPNAASSSGR